MKKGILALSLLFLLTLASQCSWCAAEGSARLSAGHRLRPHLQIQEELHGKKDLEIQSPSRRLGFGHEASTVEMKHHRRMVTGHKGGCRCRWRPSWRWLSAAALLFQPSASEAICCL